MKKHTDFAAFLHIYHISRAWHFFCFVQIKLPIFSWSAF